MATSFLLPSRNLKREPPSEEEALNSNKKSAAEQGKDDTVVMDNTVVPEKRQRLEDDSSGYGKQSQNIASANKDKDGSANVPSNESVRLPESLQAVFSDIQANSNKSVAGGESNETKKSSKKEDDRKKNTYQKSYQQKSPPKAYQKYQGRSPYNQRDPQRKRPTLNVYSRNLLFISNVPENLHFGSIRRTIENRFGKVKFVETFEAWCNRKIGHIIVEFDQQNGLRNCVDALDKQENLFGRGVKWLELTDRNDFFTTVREVTGVDILRCKGEPPVHTWSAHGGSAYVTPGPPSMRSDNFLKSTPFTGPGLVGRRDLREDRWVGAGSSFGAFGGPSQQVSASLEGYGYGNAVPLRNNNPAWETPPPAFGNRYNESHYNPGYQRNRY